MTRARGQPKIGKHKETQCTLHFTMALQPRLIHYSMTAGLCREYELNTFVKVCLSPSRCAIRSFFVCCFIVLSLVLASATSCALLQTTSLLIVSLETLSLVEISLLICLNSPCIISSIIEQLALCSFHPSSARGYR
jgi:hypothetical protein